MPLMFAFYSPALLCMDEMKCAIAREQEERREDGFAFKLVISASIIAAVRLAREDISTVNTHAWLARSVTALPWLR